MKTLKELLVKFNFSYSLEKWVGDKTIEEVVKECHRGDWLLWLAKRLKLPERKLIACAGHCANTVKHLMKDKKSIKLVKLCMNFEDERISFKKLENAREAASYYNYHSSNFTAVAEAIAYTYSDANFTSYVNTLVYADDAVARKENQLQTANIVRERLGNDIINKVNQLLNK